MSMRSVIAPNEYKRPVAAVMAVIIIPYLICYFIVGALEEPFWRGQVTAGKERRAAIAIRDNVSPFEKWGSRSFTLPYLEKYYPRSYYITQSTEDDHRAEFINDLRAALKNYDKVDIFLLAHTNNYIDWVREVEAPLRQKIRLVYNTGCYNSAQAEQWLKLGAKTYIAHPGISQSPFFYFFFLRRWTLGYPARKAATQGNAYMQNIFFIEGCLTSWKLDPAVSYLNSEAICYGDANITID